MIFRENSFGIEIALLKGQKKGEIKNENQQLGELL